MNQNKYYTPKIENIKIGYQCEYTNKSENQWILILIDKEFLTDYYRNEHYLLDVEFRTKYLTKEDIESCGWLHQYYEKDIHSWSKKDLILTTFDSFKRIKINYKTGYQLFDGNCPSINELKYITEELLNIN